jgi:TonB family protein
VIKASLLLAICGCAIPALRRRSAAERHLLWATALAAAAALPVLTFVLPPWRPSWTVLAALPASLLTTSFAVTQNDVDVIVRANAIEASWTVGRVIALTWIVGAAAILLKLGGDAWKLARLARSAEPLCDAEWAAVASDVAGILGMTRRHRLLESPSADMPMTWGLWPARVLLPACPMGWSDERRRVVIAHELAHASRWDWLVQIGTELVCAAYWFNPLFWMARRGLHRESERACDDLVLSLGVDGGDYAAHLLDIARMGRAPVAPSLGMARLSGLEQRLTVLLDTNINRRAVTRAAAWTVLAACVVVVVPLAAVSVPEADTAIDVRTANLPLLNDSAPNAAEMATTPPQVRLVSPRRVGRTPTAPQIAEYTTPPLYSDEARARHVEGIVTIQAGVDEQGNLGTLKVVRGLGFGLDQNALVAVRQWRFRPGAVDGRPVETIAEIDVEFSLSHEALNELIANDMATRVGPGVTPPRAVRTVAVRRPSSAAGARAGSVLLDVVLLEDGTPRIVRILRALNPELDDRAVRAFEQWRFSPAMKNGRPVKVRLNAEVHFRG